MKVSFRSAKSGKIIGMLTYILIAINVVISLIGFSLMNRPSGASLFLFNPKEVAAGRNYAGMVLSHFSHAHGAHLIFNMMTLFFFGPEVEVFLGAPGMLLIYIAAGIASTVLVYYRHRSDPLYRSLGASDSISGILFAAIVVRPDMRVAFLLLPIPIPAPVFAIGYVVISAYLMRRGEGHISHEAHLAGAAAGFFIAGALSPYGFRPLFQELRYLLS